jgi:spore coat polysaccharide biosynthesis predicted glycosyltransferase SpsG/CMP-N-acetylneuraminic acid synthetase
MNGKPLIFYSIDCAKKSIYNPDIFVSSDDDEILLLAKKFGALTHKRPASLSTDRVTLDPVVCEAYNSIIKNNDNNYTLVVTLQPTSPLLKTSSLDGAISKMMANPSIDTIISARLDTHLIWSKEGNNYIPKYEKRLNRQDLPPVYRETGGFMITRKGVLSTDTRIGKKVEVFPLTNGEEIDIDSYEDWNTCEFLMKRKKILFVVAGNNNIGLGHVHRALILANEIHEHELSFLVLNDSDVGYKKIQEFNYDVRLARGNNVLKEIKQIDPDLVINDRLDTSFEYTFELKRAGIKIVNFEDMGEGVKNADFVINALYPEKFIAKNIVFGHDYFCARDEFIYSEKKQISPDVRNVLISFGGTDENNLTMKVLNSIYEYCESIGIGITVVTGLGYLFLESLKRFSKIDLIKNTRKISDYMLASDIIFTSAGGTVYEIACLGVPTIVIAQNDRELTHYFAHPENGFINLGLGKNIGEKEIQKIFRDTVDNYDERVIMQQRMLMNNIRTGKKRVISMIRDLLNNDGL